MCVFVSSRQPKCLQGGGYNDVGGSERGVTEAPGRRGEHKVEIKTEQSEIKDVNNPRRRNVTVGRMKLDV